MKTKMLSKRQANALFIVPCFVAGWMLWNAGNACKAQDTNAPVNLSPDLQEVVKLSKAQMGDEVILSYIRKSGKSFQLSADDMLHLKSEGVSQVVLAALLQAKAPAPPSNPNPVPVAAPQPSPAFNTPPPGAPAPQSEATAPPAPEVNFNYFHEQLSPFGTWVNVGGTMYWRPDAAINANPDWRPYYDMGRWVQTDNGLFWQSDYQWGDIPFHYGRWVRDPRIGWLWAPDYEWGPAWVFWRHGEADAAIGWAPLPVGAVFVDGAFMFNGVRVGVDFDFGLGEGVFVFVGYDHFHEGFFRMRGREYAWHIHGDRFHDFYRRSVIRNEFRRDEHGRFVNHGIGRERMERAAHVEHAKFEERHPVGDRNKLAAQRSEAGHTGVKPGEAGHTGVKPGEAGHTGVKPGEAGHTGVKPGEVGHAGGGAQAQAPSKVFRPPPQQQQSPPQQQRAPQQQPKAPPPPQKPKK